MGPHMHCSALLLANWRPNHSREPQRPPRSRNLVNLDISKAATRMVTAHVQPDRDPAEVRQSAAARQHMQCGERDLCHAGSRFEGIADVRHPHGRTEYGRLCRRCAGAQAAPRGGAGMQPTKATRAGTFMRASEMERGGREGRCLRSWGGFPWGIWWPMMVVMLCDEVEGEGELIGMSGLGDCWVGGRCAQAKGGGAMPTRASRNGLAAATASVEMGKKSTLHALTNGRLREMAADGPPRLAAEDPLPHGQPSHVQRVDHRSRSGARRRGAPARRSPACPRPRLRTVSQTG